MDVEDGDFRRPQFSGVTPPNMSIYDASSWTKTPEQGRRDIRRMLDEYEDLKRARGEE